MTRDTSAADIGQDFSSYVGNAGAASGNFGPITADTKPLENLAAYTMLYNKTVWQENQRQTDAKVAQLADLSNISLNDLREKDKVQATKEFSTLLQKASEYARKIPKTSQERIQNELDWQTEYGKFKNNFNSGKQRAISYTAHYNTIKQNVPDATTQDEAIRQLDRNFNETDIGTPISAVPNFKMEKFDIPDPVKQNIDVVDLEGNDNVNLKGSLWVANKNAPIADATILEIGKANVQKGSPEYNLLTQNEKDQADLQATVQSSGKGWLDAVTPLNQALKDPKYHNSDGSFNAPKFKEDNASNTTLMNAYNALDNMSSYSRQKKDEAAVGIFNDHGVQVKLPQGIQPSDFDAGIVNFSNGVSPTQLVMAGSFAKYKGDEFTKTVQHTGDQRAMDLEKLRELNALKLKNLDEGGANYRAGLELLGKGFVRNAKGKWEKTPTGTTSNANNGLVPYWQNYIAPQIDAASMKTTTKEGGFLGFFQSDKENPLPPNYTGDVDVPSDKISGLGVVMTGVLNSEGKPKSYSEESKTKIRFQDGKPVGVVIDGVFYDPNDINTKATSLQDKNVNNKFDTPVFGETVPQPQATPALTDAQKYLNSLKK